MHSNSIRGSIHVKIAEDRQALGVAAALATAETIRHLLATQPTVNMVFAAAPSQNEFLISLNRHPLDWDRINAFHMDEYIGLTAGAPQSFGFYLKAHLFDLHLFRQVHLLNGTAPDVQAECQRYAALLEACPTDIVCMGIGENNHIAFNDPPVANFRDPDRVKIVTLDPECRQQQVNDGCFPSLADVPQQALTLTIPSLLAARYIFAMVPGERKANAIFHTFNSPITESYPSTILRTHSAVELFLDCDSSKLIQP
ncbi:glucosamine-6-phosphate deaminase [Puia dinghuensis]|uniref:Glucosamine-6-phosphate deaminase n=1 Tax=Puia dinghuensis TaxID=1792502 RepID=A0A8J2XTN9_9BACT|nr:glucosamine-6-phosphate deaminase [Puia dinghuensis]GGB05088.1 glucosamine-6-phosphate deaminase [Puia dinghuensis]